MKEKDGLEGITSNITITSSKTDVATASLKTNSSNTIEVSSKNIEGDTTITVIYTGLKPKTCQVNVVEPILATSMTLNEEEYTVTGGQSWKHTLQLVATIEPSNATSKEVTWKSSNSAIATVDSNGLVKAGTKGGETTITATAKDGSKVSKTCKITTELFGKTNAGVTTYTDSDGNTAKIPDGYAVGTSENVNKVTGGLVAQDNEGNQFVWIPVGDVKKNNTIAFTVALGRYSSFSASSTPVASSDTAIYTSESGNYKELTNSNGSSYGNTKAKDLQKFMDNTKIDGGYWLARFEASNDSGAKLKYDKATWTIITQPNAAKAARNMKSSGTYQSDLVNSYAWDTAIVFIEKSGYTGYASQNSKNTSKLNTGKSGDKVCNIYDMASNNLEWSTETCEYLPGPCNYRGGGYRSSNYYTSFRSNLTTTNDDDLLSFRCIFYRDTDE